MPRLLHSSRRITLTYVAIFCSATLTLVDGCAVGTDGLDVELDDDAGATDARQRDGRRSNGDDVHDEDEDGPGVTTDSGKGDAGGVDASDSEDDVDSGADASANHADAGADASSTDASSDGGGGGDGGGGSDGGGGDAGLIPTAAAGEVVFSEVMFNPSILNDTDGEWLEVYNTTTTPRSLAGLILKDGGNRAHTIRDGLVIPPNTYVVLASTATGMATMKVPPEVIGYVYNAGVITADRIQLANGSTGSIVLLNGETEIARAKYGPAAPVGLGMTKATDQSIQLTTLTYDAAATASNWCYSMTSWATGSDKGTPGAPSDCP